VGIQGSLFRDSFDDAENTMENLRESAVTIEPFVVLLCIRDGGVHEIVGGVNVMEVSRGTQESVRPR
jgi:hypothetical protein